jgi:hypothetical protein
VLTTIPTLDGVLDAHAAVIGRDITAYRNHTYRVLNLCVAQSSNALEQLEKIAIAAAFHDLGIWTDSTFDYLVPSVALARSYLDQSGRQDWEPEVSAMILEHHKITPYRGHPDWQVEPFRRSDWVDVTKGALRFGLSRSVVREVLGTWPSAGFHRLLVRLAHPPPNTSLESSSHGQTLARPQTILTLVVSVSHESR